MKHIETKKYDEQKLFDEDFSDISSDDLFEMKINTNIRDRVVQLINIANKPVHHNIMTLAMFRKFNIKKKNNCIYQIMLSLSKQNLIKNLGKGTFSPINYQNDILK